MRGAVRLSVLTVAATLVVSVISISSPTLAAAVTDPPNDFFADAISVTPLPYGPATLDTTLATTETNETAPYCSSDGSNGIANTVWYRYDAPSSGGVQVNTFGSDFDTKIGVWQGTDIMSLTQVGCAHKSGVFGQFVAFHATSGLTYYIQIGGDPFDGATNPYGSLHVNIGVPVTVHRLDNATYPDLSGYPNDRFGTDAAVAEQAFPSGASTVYVANGLNFPDALGASAAAATVGAPVLLVTPTSIPAAIAHELTALHPTTIYVVGGPGSVSSGVATALGAF